MAVSISGKTLAITRGPEDAAEFSRLVQSQGGIPVPLPTIRLVGRGRDISGDYLRECASYDPHHTVFMSSRAVGLLLDNAMERGALEAVRLAISNTNVVSVGPKTTAALKRYHIRVNAEPKSVYSSVGVGEVFSRMDRADDRVLVPRSGASTPFLRELLEKVGFKVRETYLYDTKPHQGGPVWVEFADMLHTGRVDGMVFTSVSSVRGFFDVMSRTVPWDVAEALGPVAVVSIGPFTAEELDRVGIRHTTSRVHTVAGSLDVLRGMMSP